MSATHETYEAKARAYVNALCAVKPNRRTGSAGNRAATAFFLETLRPWSYALDTAPFECLDYLSGPASLTCGGRTFEVFTSPYSLPADASAPLMTVTTVDELADCGCRGAVLLMKGEVASEQLMPKNFVFYNPDHHKRIYALLEEKQPSAIVTATGKNPDLVGALYPFPLIEDGDFDIPSVYCTEDTGAALAAFTGQSCRVKSLGSAFPLPARTCWPGKIPPLEIKSPSAPTSTLTGTPPGLRTTPPARPRSCCWPKCYPGTGGTRGWRFSP